MPAQRPNPAARAAHVAKQKLNDRGGSNVLHTNCMLRPAYGIYECARLVASGITAKRFSNFQEEVLRNPASLFDHFRRIARVVLFENLEDTLRVLQSRVSLFSLNGLLLDLAGVRFSCSARRFRIHAFVTPFGNVVLALLLVPSAEETVQVFRVFEILVDDRGRVRVVEQVLLEVALVLNDIADNAAQERDV